MADNTTLNTGTGGDVIATDDIAGVKHQRVKLEFGGDGVATDVQNSNPLPVNLRDSAGTEIGTLGNPIRIDPIGGAGSIMTVDCYNISAQPFPVQDSEKVVDNAAFTDGTTKVQPAGFIYDEIVGTALTENDAGAARMDSKRAQVTVIEDTTTRGQRATVTAANALKVDGSAVTQPVSDGGASITVDNVGSFPTQDTEKIVDGAAFTQESTKVQPVGFILDEAVGVALSENDMAAARIDSKRAQCVALEDATTRGFRATVTATGNLRVDGSTVTQPINDSEKVVDNAAFTDGTTKVQPAGFIFDETAGTALTENDAGAARMDSKRAQVTVIEDTTTRGRRTAVSANSGLQVTGELAHDAVESGNPVLIGQKAIAHGANPTAVAANDRTQWYANRHGIPFFIGGHPNIITRRDNFTAAQTDVALVTVGAGTKIVVTSIQVASGNNVTVNVTIRIGFGAVNTPANAGVVLSHPNLRAGEWMSRGDGTGILGIGADGEDLRITMTVPTTGSVDVVVSYFTIES